MWTWASLLWAYAGWAGIALATPRLGWQAQPAARWKQPWRTGLLRMSGIAGLCASWLAAALQAGAVIGTVLWLGLLSAAALALVCAQARHPRIAVAAAPLAGIAGLLAAGGALWCRG